MTNQDIIVGVDFSDSSKAALREAGHLASMRKSWLNVVHVIDIEFFEREIDQKFLTVDQLTRQAEKALKDFALEALDRPPSLRYSNRPRVSNAIFSSLDPMEIAERPTESGPRR